MSTFVTVDTQKCTGCGVCSANCPKGAIRITERVAEPLTACVGCEVCTKVCPVQAIQAQNTGPGDTTTCESCPVHCRIHPGGTGACKRFRNDNGRLNRVIPLHAIPQSEIKLDPKTSLPNKPLLTGIGAGTNLQMEPARIVAQAKVDGVDIVTCVTEAVLSFSGLRVKIDTSDYIGGEGSPITKEGKTVGYVTSSWYGSRTVTIGGVTLLKGPNGFVVARTMGGLLEGESVALNVQGGARLELTAGKPPVINGKVAEYTTFGCGSSVGKLFSKKLLPVVDECIMLDMGITGQLSEHHAALGAKPSGITVIGKRSSAGRYLVPSGKGWGGTCVENPREAIAAIDKSVAWPGLRILVMDTKVEHGAYFELDDHLEPVEKDMPPALRQVFLGMKDYCDPGNVSIIYVGGIGGGVMSILHPVDSPGMLEAIRAGKLMVTSGGRQVHSMPGGNLVVEVDTTGMPAGAFAWVPTPATSMPVEFTMTAETYETICGYPGTAKPLETVLAENEHVYLTTP